MFNPADAAKYPVMQKQRSGQSIVEKADEAVDIRDILTQMGIWAPSGNFYSYKIYCPWHEEHADPHDKNCRIFGSTNIYCWAMHGYITPTMLYARWKNLPREKAAEVLLDERGLLHKPWRVRWNELINEREAETSTKLGSKDDFISALHTALNKYPEYADNEFASEVRFSWKKVLSALDKLWELPDVDLAKLTLFFDASLTAILGAARMVSEGMEE